MKANFEPEYQTERAAFRSGTGILPVQLALRFIPGLLNNHRLQTYPILKSTRQARCLSHYTQ
jgi:hypothetical protein